MLRNIQHLLGQPVTASLATPELGMDERRGAALARFVVKTLADGVNPIEALGHANPYPVGEVTAATPSS